ncbi:sugar ABC transporter ATP-binding protein [Streptosporangium saharense]|uniref:ABC-type sugar transport system ATPase subunit n=1 Tax=Streptosporangium saharense TaxID=1706840 RepID=A0A7W7QUT7_9ACTN|nr:sugar ABC transporter ATP-binding protein [Streptosporangium saharense]MBB4920151.1 ABC-type sugar transport system ATPase subunit [Streptosporangium saharense]
MAILEARNIGKTYGGVVALKEAGIHVEAGTVHALLGENGAGKSTLIKIMSGAVTPDRGSLTLNGRQVRFRNTGDAAQHGVAVVSQELNLFPDLDILANLYPVTGPRRGPFLDRTGMAQAAAPVLDQLGLNVPVRTRLGDLSLAQRQLVEIARALLTKPRVLILDEPTSALEQASADRLLNVVRVLCEHQVGVVFVSHILEEVMALSDVITVLRNGEVVMEAQDRKSLSMPEVVAAMLGDKTVQAQEKPTLVAPQETAGGELRIVDAGSRGALSGVSLTVRPGEILGLAGLAGSGHQATLELVAGLRRADTGEVRLPSGRRAPNGLRRSIAAGVAVVSGDRRRFGLMLDKPIWENIAQVRAVALGRDGAFLRRTALRARARDHGERMSLRCSSVDQRTGLLSGGNQQKVVLAKWLDAEPSVLLLDDPTRGVDVGAKAEMHTLIRSATQAGTVTMLCSTDVEELASLCDRVAVFYRGKIAAILEGETLTQHTILELMNTGES